MTTSTVETRHPAATRIGARSLARWRFGSSGLSLARTLPGLAACALGALSLVAGPLPGPWVPLFKGIEHAVGTNQPGVAGNFPRLQVAHCIRVDLTDPDVRLFTTPAAASYDVESRETLTQAVPGFLRQHRLQVACDANYYSANPGGADPTKEGVSCDVFGLQVSTGTVVSPQTTADIGGDPRFAALLFTTNNQPAFNFVNRPPGTNLAGIYTAVTGYYPIVSNGVNIGAATIKSYPDNTIHQVQPRTVFGLSQDNHYLLLMTVDGRQSDYSDGALDTETAYWMLQFGAWNAINMDGGGSTALYMADSTGQPVAVNHSSYLAAYGRERYVGSHFGVWAKPLPGFINEVAVASDDTSATVTWSTTAPATTQVAYGPTPDQGLSTTLQTDLVTNHIAVLANLTPATDYYLQAVSTRGTDRYASSNLTFTTTNYVSVNPVFDLTHTWTYTTADLDGTPWTSPAYDDSGWDGAGPGLLWVDVRATGPNPEVQPRNTPMPADPNNNGYPYITYYFRTHFQHTNGLAGVVLNFTNYLDDGAVFYLNGVEVYRLLMEPAPAAIANQTLAAGYGCSGDATCPLAFSISGDAVTNLVAGDNVLAVEVHNYNARSPDITFGVELSVTEPVVISPTLQIAAAPESFTLTWNRSGFTLQTATAPAGPWTDVPGPVVTSPYSAAATGTAQFFRLRK